MTAVAAHPLTVARTRRELAAALVSLPSPRRLVATMGALHAGHGALLDAAGPGAVLSIFVNPLQFGPGEDLDRYPRTVAADLDAAARHRASLAFLPTAAEMYPTGTSEVSVHAGPVGDSYEGVARPGHFDGVLTVVAKLFGLIRPDIAYFGAKDAQQLALVRAMVRDLEFAVQIEEIDTVREPDGLASSSRNRYLSADQRQAALAIPRALASSSLTAARQILAAESRLVVAYCDLVDPISFTPVDAPPGRLVVAAYAGSTRLLDNILVPATL